MKTYYAHSGCSELGVAPQTYYNHIKNVYDRVYNDSKILSPILQKSVLIAALFHDLGKLEEDSQAVLSQPDRVEGAFIRNHVDAGVCWCLSEFEKTKDYSYLYSAYLILSHHHGLCNRKDVFAFNIDIKDFTKEIINILPKFRDEKNKEFTDKNIDDFYSIHCLLFSEEVNFAKNLTYFSKSVYPVELRVAFSILVDADHGDTGNHYGAPVFSAMSLKAKERIEVLNSYVDNLKKDCLKKGMNPELIESRNKLFSVCSEIDILKDYLFLVSAPTGKGKTLSTIKLALRIAEAKKKDRIFYIIPFTNIINQSASVYKDCIVLPSEDSRSVVNEIHSKVEFSSFLHRKYSQLWNAPINISTSVQFFNSLTSNHPSAVRKIKQFANSVIVFDEYHTALPHSNWKVALEILLDLCEQYNIDIIFSSGSQILYWENFKLRWNINKRSGSTSVPHITSVISDECFEEFKDYENERINFKKIGKSIDSEESFFNEFCNIAAEEGKLKENTIIVLNTIANAVNITRLFMNRTDWKIFHFSSHITPLDREIILEKIKKGLKSEEKVLVVSTSAIECGVDISFGLGFREIGTLMSTIQLGGRINRNKEKDSSFLYEFSFAKSFLRDKGNTYSENPGIQKGVICRGSIEVDPDFCTAVIEKEIDHNKAKELSNYEQKFDYEDLSEKFQVIVDSSIVVIIKKEIIEKIKAKEFVQPSDINRNSVSIYDQYILENGKWCHLVESIKDEKDRDIFFWTGDYDPDMFGIHCGI